MSDLDLGMNTHMSEPITWDDSNQWDRGKVMDYEMLENSKQRWGRYLDIDDDGIPYRTIPGTHPNKGAFFTRGSSHDEYAAYTEDGKIYARGMQRLLKKWDTAKALVPAADILASDNNIGVIYYGTSSYAAREAEDLLNQQGFQLDEMRIKGFPFGKEVERFVNSHDCIFIIEQNRDAQMKSLLVNELQVTPNKFISVLNIDGMPITAQYISEEIMNRINKQEKLKAVK
jgi:2-oxoglutarate ferredoxin oxidoreductase subunit alpha